MYTSYDLLALILALAIKENVHGYNRHNNHSIKYIPKHNVEYFSYRLSTTLQKLDPTPHSSESIIPTYEVFVHTQVTLWHIYKNVTVFHVSYLKKYSSMDNMKYNIG
jgi:hypothetical protein